jgi:hypothetical protein
MRATTFTVKRRKAGGLVLCVMALLGAAQTARGQSSILGTNLIVNGNAESGSAGTPTGVVASIPGWMRGAGNVNVIPYNTSGTATGGASYLQLTDPTPPDHGFQYFIGGPPFSASTSSIAQTIDVSAAASMISSNTVKYAASAYLGSIDNSGPAYVAGMAVAFQTASGGALGGFTLQPPPDAAGGLYMQKQIGLVPSGTAKITVTLTFISTEAAADSLSLVLSSLVGPLPASVLSQELVVNGGAELGPSAPPGSVTVNVPGWATSNGLSVAPYGGPNWIQTTDPGPVNRGVNLFCGNTGNEGDPDMYQDIDVSPAASLIDASQVTYQISAWLGGLTAGSPTLTYRFFDWAGNQLAATGQLGPKTPPNGGLVNFAHSDTLPPGTRRVHIDVNFVPTKLQMADNISFSLTSAAAPNLVLPQVAFGGGWYTALYFTNLNSSAVSFTLTSSDDNGNPLTLPGQSAPSVTVNLAARGSALIEAPNSGSLVEGYVTGALPAGVTGYGVFRQSVSGAPDQEAVVPLSPTTATTSTLLFDDTYYITGVAVVNLGSAAATVTATAYDNQGNMLGTGTIPLAANAKTAATLRSLIPAVAGALGSVDFSASSGNVAVLGLRFNGSAFTSIPASNP